MKYELNIIEKQATEWTPEGIEIGAKSVFSSFTIKQQFNTNDLTLLTICKAINEAMYLAAADALSHSDDIFISSDEYGIFALIEDDDGNVDNNGGWLCDYTFTVKPVANNINLMKLQG